MKKTLAIALFTFILLIQPFIILGSSAGAGGCNVAIVGSSGGVYPEDTEVTVNVTVTWSVPEDTTYGLIKVNLYHWAPGALGWSLICTGGGWRVLWYESPRTVSFGWITIGEVTKRFKFNVTLWCLHYVDDVQINCTATDEKEVTYSMTPEEHSVVAAFTMDPEAPTVNNIITFTSTSTCVNGTIVEYIWYLDGEDQEEVGNEPSWVWFSPTRGTHTVELTVVSDKGDTDTTQKTFEVTEATTVIVCSNFQGVVADGVSSVDINVTLTTNEPMLVTLSDGVSELKKETVDGKATFTYVPDTEQLVLSPAKIPQGGFPVTLTASLTDGTFESIILKVYRRPVLLVHGLWSSSKAWVKMKQWLINDGFTVDTIDYPNTESLMDAANDLKGKIKRLKQDFSQRYNANITKIDVIAHSMGGLAARYYITEWKTLADEDIKTLITVGTPHLGSPWAKIYLDLVTSNKITLGTLQYWLPKDWMGKYGPALDELVPDSPFLTYLNSQPNNPNVNYYTICGTNNWLSTFFGITLYERGLIDMITTEAYFIDGDGIVELTSQRSKKIQKGYYVHEWHCSEPGSHQVFEIASNILKEQEQQIPSVYRSPAKPILKLRKFHSSTDSIWGERFKIVRGPAVGFLKVDPQLWEIKLKEGDEINTFPVITAITYRGITFDYREDDVATAVIDLIKNDKVEGTLTIRVTPTTSWGFFKPYAYVSVLNPTTFYIYPSKMSSYKIDIHFSYTGPLTVLTKTGLVTSPDPEFTISVDENNSTSILVFNGDLLLIDNHNGTALISEGQAATINPDSHIEAPTTFNSSTVDSWWEEFERTMTVTSHILCKSVDSDGTPIDETSTFTVEDQVFSWLSAANASKGDIVEWLFEGQNGIVSQLNYTLDWNGEGYCYATLNLNEYDSVDASGDWTATVYVNGVEAFTDQFTVEPLTGLVWWGPIIGLLMIAVPVSFAIIIVVILINRRKT